MSKSRLSFATSAFRMLGMTIEQAVVVVTMHALSSTRVGRHGSCSMKPRDAGDLVRKASSLHCNHYGPAAALPDQRLMVPSMRCADFSSVVSAATASTRWSRPLVADSRRQQAHRIGTTDGLLVAGLYVSSSTRLHGYPNARLKWNSSKGQGRQDLRASNSGPFLASSRLDFPGLVSTSRVLLRCDPRIDHLPLDQSPSAIAINDSVISWLTWEAPDDCTRQLHIRHLRCSLTSLVRHGSYFWDVHRPVRGGRGAEP